MKYILLFFLSFLVLNVNGQVIDNLNLKRNVKKSRKVKLRSRVKRYKRKNTRTTTRRKSLPAYDKSNTTSSYITGRLEYADKLFYEDKDAQAFSIYKKYLNYLGTYDCYNLGYIYQYEYAGNQRNLALAIKYYKKAVADNYAPAKRQLGYAYLEKDNLREANIWMESAANQGDMGALIYSADKELKNQNFPKAKIWIDRLVLNKSSAGYYYLGYYYLLGGTGTQMVKSGIAELEKAANMGHERAMLLLGLVYSSREYKRRRPDFDMALYWLNKVKKFANDKQLLLGIVHFEQREYQMAYEELQAAEENNSYFGHSLTYLADLYFMGYGGAKKDYKKAFALYEKALTKTEDKQAYSRLGLFYYFGPKKCSSCLNSLNRNKAKEYFNKGRNASEQIISRYMLGDMDGARHNYKVGIANTPIIYFLEENYTKNKTIKVK